MDKREVHDWDDDNGPYNGGISPAVRAETHRSGSSLYSYPTLNEGDFLTLQMLDKYQRHNNIAEGFNHYVNINIPNMIEKISNEMEQEIVEIRSLNNYLFIVFEDIMVQISNHNHAHDGSPFQVTGRFYAAIHVFNRLWDKFSAIDWGDHQKGQPFITWATKSMTGIKTNRLKASSNKNVKNVFYPFLEEDDWGTLKDFYEDYEGSSASILVLLGPPGMGKTSLIRDYIYQYNKDCLVTYDQELMETDEFFLYFLENTNNLLLLEDFDIFLKSREDNDNRIMNKFLNLSEGIVDISQKKIVITANLDKSQIDPALIRPGRCFEVIELNRYTEREATKIIESEGLTFIGKRDNVSLAELFANKKRVEDRASVGFHARRSER